MKFTLTLLALLVFSFEVGKNSIQNISLLEPNNTLEVLKNYALLNSFEELAIDKNVIPALERKPASKQSFLSQPEKCSAKSDRLYLEDKFMALEKTNSLILVEKAGLDDESVPRQCVVYAQRSRNRRAELKPSKSYAKCENEDSEPSRNAKKPCVTESYANVIHNAYTDVMDCFGLNQKLYFSQVVFESAFHINAIAHNNYDSGLGQYTHDGIRHIIDSPVTRKIFNSLYQSGKPSCNRIAKFMRQDLTAQEAKVKNRCAFILPPRNPIQSLTFFAIHHLRDEVLLEIKMEERKIFEQLIELGWVDDFEAEENLIRQKRLVKALSLLSYNAGVEKTLTMLKNYLNNRSKIIKTENSPLADSDFDFTSDTSVLRRALRKVTIEKFREFFQQSKVKRLSFPEYVLIYHSGYMHELNQINLEFESKFGSGCTSSVDIKI